MTGRDDIPAAGSIFLPDDALLKIHRTDLDAAVSAYPFEFSRHSSPQMRPRTLQVPLSVVDLRDRWARTVQVPENVGVIASSMRDFREREPWDFSDSISDIGHYVSTVRCPERGLDGIVVIRRPSGECRKVFEALLGAGALLILDTLFDREEDGVISSSELMVGDNPSGFTGPPAGIDKSYRIYFIGKLPEGEYDKIAFMKLNGINNALAMSTIQPQKVEEACWADFDLFSTATFGRVSYPAPFRSFAELRSWEETRTFSADFLATLTENVPLSCCSRSALYREYEEIEPVLGAAEASWRRHCILYPEMSEELLALDPSDAGYAGKIQEIGRSYGVDKVIETILSGVPEEDVLTPIPKKKAN